MRINKIENAQSFNAVYKVKVSPSKLKYFDETVASVYRANKKSGIRAFFKKPSEMFALTGKDAYEFDRKYDTSDREKASFHHHSDGRGLLRADKSERQGCKPSFDSSHHRR